MNRRERRALEREAHRAVHPVALAFVHPGSVTATFDYSKDRAMIYEIGRTGGKVLAQIRERCASGQLVDARNETVKFFLDETPCVWYWCCDTDMGFGPDVVERLLASADATERPIMGALCFGLKKHGEDEELQAVKLRCFPTLYRFVETAGDAGFLPITDYPRDAIVPVDATGAACFIVHRRVLEAMRARDGDNWFTPIAHVRHGNTFSEDLSFFARAAGAGFNAYVDTGIKTSHDKGSVSLTEEAWDAQQALSFSA